MYFILKLPFKFYYYIVVFNFKKKIIFKIINFKNKLLLLVFFFSSAGQTSTNITKIEGSPFLVRRPQRNLPIRGG